MMQLLVLGLIAGVGPSSAVSSAPVVPDFGADFQPAQGPNMNGDFVLSTTPGGKEGLFPKTYTDYPGGVEAYDVLSPPITTLYSQVWWAPLAPVSFPEEMVTKYANKTVAIVGWEIDQVRVLPDGTEQSVPISATYNHHYNLQMIGAAAKFKKIWLNGPQDPRAKELLRASHGMVAYDQPHYVPEIVGDTSRGPASAFVTSGNGGEYRKTFHGFAPGHAVVIDSPTQIQLSPMQIDTWNRDEMDISQPLPPKFVAGPLPRSSEAPVNASYSGLLECPMTTRLTKVIDGAYVVQGAGGVCATPILTFQECFHAAASTLGTEGTPASQFKNVTGSDPLRPAGCSVSSSIDSGSGSNRVQVYFNELTNSTVGCAAGAGVVSGAASSLVDVTVSLNATSNLATISLTGPSDVWFGVGFGAQAMADRPWTIVVDGDGNVTERHLGGESPNSHVAGDPLQPSVTVVGSSVAAALRTVVLTRPFQGAGPGYYTFNATGSDMVIPFINAVGSGPDLAYVPTHFTGFALETLHFFRRRTTLTAAALGFCRYHKDKAPAKLALLPQAPASAGACICPEAPAPFGMATGQLVYRATNQSGDVGTGSVAFGQQKCKPFPATVLNEQRNPTCDIRCVATAPGGRLGALVCALPLACSKASRSDLSCMF